MEELEASKAFHRPLKTLSVIRLVIRCIVLAVLAFSPLGISTAQLVTPSTPTGYEVFSRYPLAVAAIVILAGFPFALLEYIHLARNGVSRQRPARWLGSWLTRAVSLTILLGSFTTFLLTIAGYWNQRIWPPLDATLVMLAAVLVVGYFLWPRLRPRLLDEAVLADAEMFSARTGIRPRIALRREARRTSHENAVARGFGPLRQIDFYDTFLARASRREVRAVLAHEFAHFQAHDEVRELCIAILSYAGIGAAAWLVIHWPPIQSATGFEAPWSPFLAPVILLSIGAARLLLAPLTAALTRKREVQADLGAVALSDDADGLILALRNVGLANRDELLPGMVSRAFRTHPPDPERFTAITEAAAPAARSMVPETVSS